MAGFTLKSFEFRREREASWRELEALVRTVEKRGLKALGPDELHRLPHLYRAALSSLSVARAISLDKNVIGYLEGLASRAYFAVYCRKRHLGASALTFFTRSFPRMVRSMRWPLLLAVSLFLLGTLSGYAMTSEEPDRYYTFVSEGVQQDRSPASSREELAEVLTDNYGADAPVLTQFAAFLFSHNATIGLACFALGFAAGVPVLLLLFYNGLTIGALWAVYADRGLGFEFFAWVMPHGVTEILAICVSGAAGLAIGQALVFPGRYSRLTHLARRGRQMGIVAVGAVIMFAIAALIEGYFRQLVGDTDARIAVTIVSLVLWTAYLTFAGRGGPADDPAEEVPA